jgi:hypothetical protein
MHYTTEITMAFAALIASFTLTNAVPSSAELSLSEILLDSWR